MKRMCAINVEILTSDCYCVTCAFQYLHLNEIALMVVLQTNQTSRIYGYDCMHTINIRSYSSVCFRPIRLCMHFPSSPGNVSNEMEAY